VLEESVNENSDSDVTSPGNALLSMLNCSTPLATLACETAVESCQIPVSMADATVWEGGSRMTYQGFRSIQKDLEWVLLLQ
jgi:hypothetical protein